MSVLFDTPAGRRPFETCFLVGAPRSGTTFLAKALAKHPAVCFSKPKETHFFVRDCLELPPDRWAAEFQQRYFPQLEDGHRMIAEGSPLQLRDPQAIESLLRFDPDTRLLVAVRNPADMAYSLHARLLYLLDEDERDFRRAWQLQEARARGERIPRRCRDPRSLQYRAMCSVGAQLERLFGQIDRGRVHVVVFDDLVGDTVKTYRHMLEFLGLPDDGRTEFDRKNENREYRHAWAQAYVTNPPKPVATLLESWQRKGKGRPTWVRRIRRRIKEWNTRKAKRAPLDLDLRAELRAAFAPDVERLEHLLGRDLSHWR